MTRKDRLFLVAKRMRQIPSDQKAAAWDRLCSHLESMTDPHTAINPRYNHLIVGLRAATVAAHNPDPEKCPICEEAGYIPHHRYCPNWKPK